MVLHLCILRFYEFLNGFEFVPSASFIVARPWSLEDPDSARFESSIPDRRPSFKALIGLGPGIPCVVHPHIIQQSPDR